MLTASLMKEGNKVYFRTECGITSSITQEEADKLTLSRGTIRCPRFTGKSCSNENLHAVKNDHTREMFREQFIQLRSPVCVANEDVQVDWKKYELYLATLTIKEEKVIRLDDE